MQRKKLLFVAKQNLPLFYEKNGWKWLLSEGLAWFKYGFKYVTYDDKYLYPPNIMVSAPLNPSFPKKNHS
jgi:hypothetical protein